MEDTRYICGSSLYTPFLALARNGVLNDLGYVLRGGQHHDMAGRKNAGGE
jgi:hypothetical protein